MMDPLAEMAALVPSRRGAGFWFLASPYSKYPEGLDAAYRVAVEARGLLIHAGVPVFSPIVHSHPVAEACGIDPLSHEIWLPAEAPMRYAAMGMIELRAAGWADSYGMRFEREEFLARKMPVVVMTPGELPKEFDTRGG